MAKGKYKEWLTKDALTVLEGWARNGLTDAQVSDNIGINVSTLYEWKKKYPEINDALKSGKEVIDIKVENALLKAALGYEEEEVKRFIQQVDGKRTEKIEKTKRHYPPNVTALIFWLKNRKPEFWRDIKAIDARQDISADTTLKIEMDYGTDTN